MEPVELWLYRAIIIAILGFVIWVGQSLITKVDKLTETINNLNNTLTRHDTDMTNIKAGCAKREIEVNRRFAENEFKIEDHEERIRELEK
ncbi:MAG TPA: hypothetical protein PKH02_02025 [Bacteroidales bacterium]|nr:hypothetical protein [Bacteroidales bacterium]